MKWPEMPTAKEMGAKLDYLSDQLFRAQLIQACSKSLLYQISKQLKELR
jgi:hypothetical protein